MTIRRDFSGFSPSANPDAELIRVCAEEPAYIAEYNAGGGELDLDDDPLWWAHEQSRDSSPLPNQ